MSISGAGVYNLVSSILPAREPVAAGKGSAATDTDADSKQKAGKPVPERRADRSRLRTTESGKKTAPETSAPAPNQSLHTAPTWASDATTLVAEDNAPPSPDGARIAREQVRRCDAYHERSIASKLRDNLKGMATLSSTDAPPAFQLQGDNWDAAIDIVNAVHWELQRTDPANIDPVELAHAVACVERWRCEGHADNARDDAIDAWLKAFSLQETMSVQSLIDSYAAGSTGYEHKGKGITANLVTGLTSGVVSAAAHVSAEAAIAVKGIRSVGGIIGAGYERTSGMERFGRLPQEELAPLLVIDAKERASKAPSMREALQLARQLHRAAGKGKADGKQPTQEQLIAHEKMVKARLNMSAEKWIGKRRELPVRAVATGMMGTGAALGLSLSPAAFLAPVLVGGAAAMHASYRLMGWDRADTRDYLRLRLFNHIKSYVWAADDHLPRARIAELYGKFEEGEITREELAEEVKPLLVHAETGKAMRFPVELRLGHAEELLRGKFAEALDKELKRLRKGENAVDADAEKRVRELLADLFNVQRTKDLIVYAARLSHNGLPERVETVLKSAASCLQAVSDVEVRDLFTGDMAAQTKAVTHARSLIKGEASSFKYTIGIGSLPGIALVPAAMPGGELVHALSSDEATAAFKAGTAAGAGPAAGLAVNLAPAKAVSQGDAGTPNKTYVIPVDDRPARAEDFAEHTLDALLRGNRMPAEIVFEPGAETLGAEVSGRRINDLTASEPHARADRRGQGIGVQAKLRWSRAAAGASATWESAREPFLRQAVSYYMRRSRKSRRERQRAVENLQAASAGEESSPQEENNTA